MSPSVSVIVNPASGRGRGRRALNAVRRAFERVGVTDVRCTAHAGEERLLAERALEEGAGTIAAVGGDGTWSNVADSILARSADCRLALMATGTGNDFARSLGVPATDLIRTAQLCVDGSDRLVDVGRVEGRHFLNIAGFGFDTAVLEDSLRPSLLRGRALYLSAALRQLFRYRGLHIDVATGGDAWRGEHLMLIVANARHFGGGFLIAPDAQPHDGLLDTISIADASRLRRLALFRAVLGGRHLELPEVRVARGGRVVLRFASPPAFEADGEYRLAANSEVEVTCVPAALRVVTHQMPGAV